MNLIDLVCTVFGDEIRKISRKTTLTTDLHVLNAVQQYSPQKKKKGSD